MDIQGTKRFVFLFVILNHQGRSMSNIIDYEKLSDDNFVIDRSVLSKVQINDIIKYAMGGREGKYKYRYENMDDLVSDNLWDIVVTKNKVVGFVWKRFYRLSESDWRLYNAFHMHEFLGDVFKSEYANWNDIKWRDNRLTDLNCLLHNHVFDDAEDVFNADLKGKDTVLTTEDLIEIYCRFTGADYIYEKPKKRALPRKKVVVVSMKEKNFRFLDVG